MKHYTIRNLTIAVIVPTFLFIAAIVGVRHINLPIEREDIDSTMINEYFAANISLTPHLEFDSLVNNNGEIRYFVNLDRVFSNSELKGLWAYITKPYAKFSGNDIFICDGGVIGDSLRIIKQSITNKYYLVDAHDRKTFLGRSIFDTHDNLWYNLSSYNCLQKK